MRWRAYTSPTSLGLRAGPKRTSTRKLGKFGELLLITSSPSKAHIDTSSFYIPRDDEEPPPELLKLLKLVWPELDDCINIKLKESEQNGPPCLAAFMNLLQQLRRYLLQDSAILRPTFPDHSGLISARDRTRVDYRPHPDSWGRRWWPTRRARRRWHEHPASDSGGRLQ
jgi:Centromere DNA-binding protein complex CBF3 subunit, domain 2